MKYHQRMTLFHIVLAFGTSLFVIRCSSLSKIVYHPGVLGAGSQRALSPTLGTMILSHFDRYSIFSPVSPDRFPALRPPRLHHPGSHLFRVQVPPVLQQLLCPNRPAPQSILRCVFDESCPCKCYYWEMKCSPLPQAASPSASRRTGGRVVQHVRKVPHFR